MNYPTNCSECGVVADHYYEVDGVCMCKQCKIEHIVLPKSFLRLYFSLYDVIVI